MLDPVQVRSSALLKVAPMARRLLRRLAGLAAVGLVLAAAPKAIAERAAVNLPTPPTGDAPIVGAYYYPWYAVAPQSAAEGWKSVMRRRLAPSQQPALGFYQSDDAATVAEHLRQSRQAGLAFWAVSWWGPDSTTDKVFLQALLPHDDAAEFRFAVLYESTGRLGSFDRPRYDNWSTDLAYLAKHYFGRPNYLRIAGRPVVFVYLSREYFRNQGDAALTAGRALVPEVYLVGDDVFGPDYRREWARQFDAVTAYDVYGQSTGLHGSTRRAVDALAANYAAARETANAADAAFIPAVAPGYNDAAVRSGHQGSPRYFVDVPGSREGDLFRAMIRNAALPNLDDRAGRLMMVTSFNEWYEDTQIEATAGGAPATSADDSESGRMLTGGDRYEDYGTLFLDILRETAGGASPAR